MAKSRTEAGATALAIVQVVLVAAVALVAVFAFGACTPGYSGCCETACWPRPCCPGGLVDAAPERPKGTGFMQGYDQMTRDPEDRSTWIWQKPGMDLRTYDHLLIDPIVVVPTPGSETEKLSAELRTLATDSFRKMLVARVDPYYSVVTEAGPHVLRLRVALTDLKPVPEMEAGKPAVGMGGAALEAEFIDSTTGEVLERVIDRISGSTRGTEANEKWRAVEGAFLEWADRLLDFMDRNTATK